ncbi:MAG: carboxymuconolactone decarboxylase family protein [Pseudomonadota bacterium]
MSLRFDITEETPDLYKMLRGLNAAIAQSGLDEHLIHLSNILASQINGCSYCVATHVNEAIEYGVSERLLHMVSVWRESDSFNARERAVLEWTECLTSLPQSHVSEEVFETVSSVLSEREIAQLTIAVSTMNLWNRIGVSSGMSS